VARIIAEERGLGVDWVAAESARFSRLAQRYCFLDPESRSPG
jgi:hypothetical protein